MLRKILIPAIALIALAGCTGNTNWSRESPPDGTKVTVVEFSDFNCPACRAASETASKIKGLPNLYFEFRHLPLPISGHESSPAAANTFECAREQGFGQEMEEALFKNQGSFTESLFLRIPKTYDFDEDFDQTEFAECVSGNNYADLVEADYNFARQQGLNSTPTFFVNGIKTTYRDLLKTVAAAFEVQNASSTE
ncbi:MAG: thioredoxin domain-containing protein [Candidatus Peribacteraceae bacterium]|nr:thioredoxin domain-containing protein [Candidatus Peribacteraceae bacterium]